MEDPLQEDLQCSFEVSHGDPLIQGQNIHLIKHGRVGRVRGIAPVDLAGAHGPDRRLHYLHGVDLDRGAMSTQERRLVEVERILRVASRMASGHVQGVKVVILLLDLGEVENPKAQADEDLLDFSLQPFYGMLDAECVGEPRARHVHAPPRDLQLPGPSAEPFEGRVQFPLDVVAQLVGGLAESGSVFARELP